MSLNGVHFALVHYPMFSWPKKNSGSIQLYGHIHAREEYNLQNRVNGIRKYDVGVDTNNYYPVSVKQIVEFFEDSVKIWFENLTTDEMKKLYEQVDQIFENEDLDCIDRPPKSRVYRSNIDERDYRVFRYIIKLWRGI